MSYEVGDTIIWTPSGTRWRIVQIEEDRKYLIARLVLEDTPFSRMVEYQLRSLDDPRWMDDSEAFVWQTREEANCS